MDSSKPPVEGEQDGVDALEVPDNATSTDESSAGDKNTQAGEGDSQVIDATGGESSGDKSQPSFKPPKKSFLKRFNLYLLLFGLILVLGSGVLTIAYFQSKKANTTGNIKAQDVTAETLRQIAASDANVGSSQQILNVQSSAVFAGKVLVRDGLEVATTLRVGGTTSLTGLTVSGTSQFGQVQVNNDLAVAGNGSVQGTLTTRSLQVSGGGTFGGPVSAPQITTSNFQLNGDLVLTRHIAVGGPTPGVTRGPAVGGGGSVSISGSDTAGTVNINVGSGAPAGCLAVITFAAKFNSTPHVTITPVGPDAGPLDYYVTRTTASFSICDATAPPAGTSFAFDYFITD